jgi:hypothetical protein
MKLQRKLQQQEVTQMIKKAKKMIAVILVISLCMASMSVDILAKNIVSQTSTVTKAVSEEIVQETEQETEEETTRIETTQNETTQGETTQNETIESETTKQESIEETKGSTVKKFSRDSSEIISSKTINTVDDLVELSKTDAALYQNATITIAPSDGVLDMTESEFSGLGSKEYPFSGSIVFSGNLSGSLTLNCSLFNYLSQEATINFDGVSFYLVPAEGMAVPLLAEYYVKGNNGTAETISIKISAKQIDNDEYSSFYGIIGTMEEGTSLHLSLTNNTPSGKTVVEGKGNKGFFCNEMQTGASLTIESYTGETDFKVTSSDSNAGAFVGSMGESTSLIIKNDITYTGSVSAKTNAGGIVGSAKDASVIVDNGKKVTIQGSIGGESASGGLVGDYTFSKNEDASWDLSNFVINNVNFTTGSSTGGVFGVLNQSSKQIFTICNGTVTSTNQVTNNYGGLIGTYTATNLEAGLCLQNVSSSSKLLQNAAIYGGLIAKVKDNSYVEVVDGATITTNKNDKTIKDFYGGVVAYAGEGIFFNIGDVTIKGNYKATTAAGGLVGYSASGVIRLHGTTDLSSSKPEDTTKVTGQLIGTRNDTLVYAMGDGNTSQKWCLKRSNDNVYVSDIGDWGEVIRVDGTTLEEDKLFDKKDHTVKIKLSTSSNSINSVSEFVAYALSFQFPESNSLKIERQVSQTDTLVLAANIDLSGTGLTGFTRDGGTDIERCKFQGTLTSQDGKKTITLATGELYGLRNGKEVKGAGSGQIYNHVYLGLFGQKNTGKVSNVCIAGTMNFGLVNSGSDVYAGAICGYQPSESQSYENVEVTTEITYHSNSGNNLPTAYVGGIVSYLQDGSNITIDGCTFEGKINNTATPYKFYNAALISYIENSKEGSIAVSNTSIKGTLYSKELTDTARVGAILASTGTNEKPGEIKITITNVNIDGLTIKSQAGNAWSVTGTMGGFLGYEWRNTNVTITGLKICNSSLTTTSSGGALFGGLVYKASGKWEVKKNDSSSSNYTSCGIEYGKGVVIQGKTDNTNPSALLVSRGDNYVSTSYTYALYLSIGEDSYEVNSETQVTLKSGNYFDELVGRSITDGVTNRNGVVSIATSEGTINTTSCTTYQKQLSKDYENPCTRYYYNLGGIADDTITSGKELVLWSVGQYCESNLVKYFVNERSSSVTLQGTIDLTGLSYYPIDYTGAVTINDAVITFGYQQIEEQEDNTNNKKPSNTKKQHSMMQDGLFLTLTSSTSTAASINITGTTDGLTLCGTIGQLDSSDYDGGSGALVCGKAEGRVNSSTNKTYPFTFSVAEDSKILLKNICVYYSEDTLDDYAPLLLNQIGSYSSLTMINVETSRYATTSAATSLMGNVGSKNDTNIVLLFENMKLDGHSATSIFTRATFMESFSYAESDIASSGSYTFNSDSTNITYGKEISNGVGGNEKKGRNVYNLEEGTGQVWYYNKFGLATSDSYVKDGSVVANENKGFFTSNYLPYVCVPEGGSDGTTKWQHEIDVNQLVAEISNGCGTSDDPYIIDNDGQLEALATFLSTGSIAGWKLHICYSVASSDGTTSFETHSNGTNSTDYWYTSGSTWNTTENTSASLTSKQVQAYLRNAYYVVEKDITLRSNFYGLGGSDPTTNVFSGVIEGKIKEDGSYPTITISTHTNSTHNYFGGLIAYSNGSVVKNIILDYSSASLTLTAKSPSQESAEQSFFGGVIGYVVGGDNIIDNVTVKGLNNVTVKELSTTFQLTITGNYEKLTSVGGYVGLISGGGVVFRSISNDTGFTGSDYKEDNDFYYRNPYVGRVLDGYACVEGDYTLENTDKNYKIPKITSSDKIKISDNTITIDSAQKLWLLSAIVNSNNYSLGRVRTGNVATDSKYWGGKTYTNKISYLTTTYVENGAYLTDGSKNYSLKFTKDLDMTDYGNGFRGVGAAYQDNQSSDIKSRTIYLGGKVSGENKKITIKRNVKEYAIEQKNSGWSVQAIGLFPTINFNAATTVENLTICGTLSISYDDTTYTGEACAGGFAGMTANSSGANSVTFKNVILDGLTVSGAKYSGGFVGVAGISKRNPSSEGSLIEVGSDTGSYTFENCSYTNITIKGGYAAGGLVGVYKSNSKTFKVTGNSSFQSSTIGWTNDASLEIYNATNNSMSAIDYGYSGAGGLVGYYSGGSLNVDSFALKSITLYAPRAAYNCNYALGGIVGVLASGSITADKITEEDVTVKIDLTLAYQSVKENDSNYYLTPAAGLFVGYGKGSNSTITLTNLSIQNCQVLNSGCSGGLIGITNGSVNTVTISTTTMKDVVVSTQGAGCYDGSPKTGGIIGHSTKTLKVSDVSMKNVTVVSDGKTGLINGWTSSSGKQQTINFSATSCTVATTQDKSAKYFLAGNTNPGQESASKGTDKVAGAAGIFIGSCSASEGGEATTISELSAFNVQISGCTVGYKNPSSGSIEINTAGRIGSLVGSASGGTIQIVGLSVLGKNYPSKMNGYENKGINDSTTNYVIYADYTGTALSNSSKDVVLYPSSTIKVYTAKGVETSLTGDGMVKNSIDSILQDVTGTTSSNLPYTSIRSIAQKFVSSNGTTGAYFENMKMYKDASESDASYSGADFPVLVVDSTQTATITALVKSYISLLTNCDQTTIDKTGMTITAQTYRWNTTTNQFVATNSSSLVVNSNKTLSVNGNSHDNQNNQFTLLDVTYTAMNQTYHLYIPVVVKRVIQTEFSVKMMIGSNTYDSAYTGTGAVLASYGDNFTAQLTYSYTWTAAEWNNYIANGNSLLWSYDKQVQLDENTSEKELHAETTKFTLVDTNRYVGNTYFTGTGKTLESDSAVLKFESFSNFESVPMSDLLSLEATKDNSGTLKIVTEEDAQATIRIWDEKTSKFVYYAPKTKDDKENTEYYTVTVVAKETTENVTASEVYYLTINCTQKSDEENSVENTVNARPMSLGALRFSSSSNDALATRMKNSGTKYYILGNFYTITNTKITTKSRAESEGSVDQAITSTIQQTTNDYIDVFVSSDVNISCEPDIFRNYASNSSGYFRFAIKLLDNGSMYPIDATSISVENLMIGTETLTTKDYTGELIGGVYYITVNSKTAANYINQNVSAEIRFSYVDDTEKIATQFPIQTNEELGVSFSVDAAMAYSLFNIDGSSMSGKDNDNTVYHREKNEISSLTYSSKRSDIISEDGNTSQLGINGKEVTKNDNAQTGQTITSYGKYDVTQISSLDLTDSKSTNYPSKLVGTLTLEKKTDEDGSTSYKKVDIDTYLSDITVEVGDESSTVKNGKFTITLSPEQVKNLSSEKLELNFSYFVKSGKSLEEIEKSQYANYKVTLTVHLENSKGDSLLEDISDYLIYTNAQFYLGILSTGDFDNN